MSNSEYTERQIKIISGEIPIESVNGKVLYWLYKKALENNDETIAQKAKMHLDLLKVKSVENNRKSVLKRKMQKSMEYLSGNNLRQMSIRNIKKR